MLQVVAVAACMYAVGALIGLLRAAGIGTGILNRVQALGGKSGRRR